MNRYVLHSLFLSAAAFLTGCSTELSSQTTSQSINSNTGMFGINRNIYIRSLDDRVSNSELDELRKHHPQVTLVPQLQRIGSGNDMAMSAYAVIESGVSATCPAVDRPIVIDLNQSDTNIVQIHQIIKSVEENMLARSEVQSLLHLESDFELEDRQKWENILAQCMAVQFAAYPLFSYREGSHQKGSSLFDDVSQWTMQSNLECRHLATIRLVVAQSVEDRILLKWHKMPTNYFIMGGTVCHHGVVLGGHVTILSELTGDLIEATKLQPPYCYPPAIPGRQYFLKVLTGESPFISVLTESNGIPTIVFGSDINNPKLGFTPGEFSRSDEYARYMRGFLKAKSMSYSN